MIKTLKTFDLKFFKSLIDSSFLQTETSQVGGSRPTCGELRRVTEVEDRPPDPKI